MSNPHPRMVELGWGDWAGQTLSLVNVDMLGRYPVKIQYPLEDAVMAMERVLIDTGYENPCDYIGSYNNRTIGDTNTLSEHAYGVALDLDYGGDTDGDGDPTIDKNPHVRRPIVPGDSGFGVEWQILEHQVRAIEGIKNLQGEPIWYWLGWAIGDTMHWAVNVGPDACEVDWSTVGGTTDMDYISWANGFFDFINDDFIQRLYDAGYIKGDPAIVVPYWADLRDIGAENRTPSQRKEVARFMAESNVSAWLKAAELE